MSKSDGYYWKEGRSYRRVYETPRLYADGVWLVTNQTNAAQRIMKIGDLKELYPYAQMAQDKDVLANYIVQKTRQWFDETLKIYDNGSIQYQNPSASEMAETILKFLAMTPKEREAEIDKGISENTHLDSEGFIRDGRGMVLYSWYSKEALTAQKKDLEEKLAKVNKMLENK